MLSIMKVIVKILFKRKSFLFTTFILPLLLIVGISALEGGASSYNIGIINKDEGQFGTVIENRLKDSDFINLTELQDKDYTEELIYHKYEMIITIDEDFTQKIVNGDLSKLKYKTLTEAEDTAVVKNIIEGEVSSLAKLCNNIDIKKEGIDEVIKTFDDSKPELDEISSVERKSNVVNSIGLIFYVIFTSASFSCAFLLEDERLGTKSRTIMGKISEKEYYGAHLLVYLLLGAIPAVEYYALCNAWDMEFGFDNKILLLVITLAVSCLAVTFNVFVSSIIKNKSVFTLVSTCFTLPMFMLSGCFWPYDMMGETLRKIGDVFPTRWLILAFEDLQKGSSFVDIIPNILGIIALSLLLFALAVYFTKNKRVLIKCED